MIKTIILRGEYNYKKRNMVQSVKQDPEVTYFVSLVPLHLRKYIKYGIFIIPTSALIDDYVNKKD